MRWSSGAAEVEQLLVRGHIERVQGAQADGASWLDRARRSLDAARVIAQDAPDSSVVLAYDAARQPASGEPAAVVDWGPYEPAIRQWESVLGLPAPVPTEPAPHGGRRLRTEFVEWMMGLVPGFVCDLEHVPRAAQLRALGNGVVPQQASYGITLLLADLSELTSPETGQAAA